MIYFFIRDDEIIYASKGENFIRPTAAAGSGDWVKLNVGGRLFYTSRTTLLNHEPGSVFAKMFNLSSELRPAAMDSAGAYLIDRDPKFFEPILNFMRTGSLILDPNVNPQGILDSSLIQRLLQCF